MRRREKVLVTVEAKADRSKASFRCIGCGALLRYSPALRNAQDVYRLHVRTHEKSEQLELPGAGVRHG